MELCTLLIKERYRSPKELPAPCTRLAMLGTPEKGAPMEKEHPGRRKLFTHGARIPGMWLPWGTAWVGLPRQGSFD